MTFIVNGKSHQIPTDVNDAITVIVRENEQLRAERNRSGVELRNAVAQAVLAEREACANVVMGFDLGEERCNEIAEEIRARSTT